MISFSASRIESLTRTGDCTLKHICCMLVDYVSIVSLSGKNLGPYHCCQGLKDQVYLDDVILNAWKRTKCVEAFGFNH